MKDKYGKIVVGTNFAVRVLIVWRIWNDGKLEEFEINVGIAAMFIGVAAGRFEIVAIVAGILANLMIGGILYCEWIGEGYFFVICQFLAGLHVSGEFFKPGIFFGIGQVCGCLLTLLSLYGIELFGYYTIEAIALLALPLIQISLYYASIKFHKVKPNNTLSNYYSSYPPQNLGIYLLYFSYFIFFLYYTSILIQFLKTSADLYNPLLYLSANLLFSLSTLTISNLIPTIYKKLAKEILIIALLVQFSISLIQSMSDTLFQVSFVFIHFFWNAINEFNLYVYAKNRHICRYWITSSALVGSIYCLLLNLLTHQIQVFHYFFCILTLLVLLMFVVSYKKIHPHPSYLPIIYDVEHYLLCQDCPYEIRKQVEEKLLMKLG